MLNLDDPRPRPRLEKGIGLSQQKQRPKSRGLCGRMIQSAGRVEQTTLMDNNAYPQQSEFPRPDKQNLRLSSFVNPPLTRDTGRISLRPLGISKPSSRITHICLKIQAI